MEWLGSFITPYLDNSSTGSKLISLPAVINISQDVLAVIATQWVSIWFIELVLEIIKIDNVVRPARNESTLNEIKLVFHLLI